MTTFLLLFHADEATITRTYPNDYVYGIWKDYFDELASEGDKVMVLKLHPQLIGRSGRTDAGTAGPTHGAKRSLDCFLSELAQYVSGFYEQKGACHENGLMETAGPVPFPL